jgi:hypothetical protein
MRYFAELDDNNLVIGVYVSDGDFTPETDDYFVVEYSLDTSVTNNSASIGYTYDENLNAFIPPQYDSTYILNMQTFEWEPDKNLQYDLHGDGKLYRYDKEFNIWIPILDSE